MIGLIGNGSWATALAKLLTTNDNKLNWWMRKQEAVDSLKQRNHNLEYLSSVHFNTQLIEPSIDLLDVVQKSEIILFCTPSAYLLDILKPLPKDALKGKTIISAIKGIIPEHFQLLQDYLIDQFNININQYFSITGPCHAEEVAQEQLSYLTFSGEEENETKKIANLFATEYLKTSCNNDLWGSQYAAVMKNIYAVGAGIAHGLGYGDNFMSVYITNCYREMYLFLHHHFVENNPDAVLPDFHTSAYLGDLLVTCYSMHSRNRAFGTFLGKGYRINDAKMEMNMVAEGYYASLGMKQILKPIPIAMPIVKHIYEILWEQKNAANHFKELEDLLT
ncbi:MAG TPA: NAD(P)H-dependent glycerol-3-phosphate dehydrogenase [Edaphocola sp.]|nr:NAD(P)H-dependent glycerol-3-phosphate dehydrogenase [Edaphocola sp.]